MQSCGLILLAAGASTRLGQPKQLVDYHGDTLLHQMVQTALETGQEHVIVVTGAHANELETVLDSEAVHVVYNKDWQEGIASSIRCGLNALLKLEPDIECALFMVCDQPFVTAALLKELMMQYARTGKTIIASAYAATIGTPALFDQVLFPDLLQLQGDTGAKKIMSQYAGEVATVSFPLGHIDIDTDKDLHLLQ